MKRLLPYLLITISFFVYLFIFNPQVFSYKMPSTLVHDYLRSQDIEDPKGLIHDRIFMSDSDIYVASGYLYAKGKNPAKYNFQHPPLIKYLFGFSTFLTRNPLYIQIIFGLIFLFLTYFLGTKLKLQGLGMLGVLGLMIDPVFRGMINNAFLDLGQAVFALGYIILMFFFPEMYVLQGIVLGLFAASKFWSTAIIFTVLVYGYKIIIRKEKLKLDKTALTFLIALIFFSLTYLVSFIQLNGMFNIFTYQGRVLKFMLSHNSAKMLGGPIVLFITGYFAPWWQSGVTRAADWSLFWPIGLVVGVIRGVREFRNKKFITSFTCLLPFIYLLLSSTQVPFTRYFIIILPFVYISLARLFFDGFIITDKHSLKN